MIHLKTTMFITTNLNTWNVVINCTKQIVIIYTIRDTFIDIKVKLVKISLDH